MSSISIDPLVMSAIPDSSVARDQTSGSGQNEGNQRSAAAQTQIQGAPVIVEDTYVQVDSGNSPAYASSAGGNSSDPYGMQSDPTWTTLQSQSTLELQLIYAGMQELGRLLDVRA